MEYNGKGLRHEYKYLINYNEYQYLKTRLGTIMQADANSGEDGYLIRSLYFDDIYDTALEEKESGIQFRQKYRIRVYGSSDSVIKLERKEKYSDYISKQAVRLTKDEFYSITQDKDIRFLLEKGKEMPKQMFWAIKTRLLRPAVIVDYKREVFVCDEGNVRITFDQDLNAGINTSDVFSDDIESIPVFDPNTMILEVKYDDYLPDYIKQAVQITSHIKTAYSKYVMCRLTQFRHNPISKFYLR